MQIQKRSGQAEAFDGGKILAAMEKSFASVGQAPAWSSWPGCWTR